MLDLLEFSGLDVIDEPPKVRLELLRDVGRCPQEIDAFLDIVVERPVELGNLCISIEAQ